MEVICINDQFDNGQLEFYKKFGVVVPKKDNMYSIRQIRNDRGTVGFLLNELLNPEVPIKSMMGGIIMLEPSFKYTRFSTLTGDLIELENFKEELV